MSRQVSVLLILGVAACLVAVAAIVVVILNSDTSATVPPAPPVADAAQSHGDPAAPPELRPARPSPSSRPVAPPAEVQPAEPDESPEDAAAREQAEKDRLARQEEAIRRIREQVIRDFKLTNEQVALAEPVLRRMQDLVAAVADLETETRALREQLQRQARDDNWTPEQQRLMQEEALRRFVLEHQGELIQFVDGAAQALEELRPHLTAEQTPRLDRQLDRLNKARDAVLQGSLKGL